MTSTKYRFAPRTRTRLWTALGALLISGATMGSARAAKFDHALYEPLKPDAFATCPPPANDVDGDCFSDSMENALATIVAA